MRNHAKARCFDAMSAIDVDSDDSALERRRAAVRRRREDARTPAPELPRACGPWDCPACDESNGEQRLKCNNCGRAREGGPAPEASARRRKRGWDDWEEQAKKAAAKASKQNAHIMSLGLGDGTFRDSK